MGSLTRFATTWHTAPRTLRAVFVLYSVAGVWVIGSVLALLVAGLSLINSARANINAFGNASGDPYLNGMGDNLIGGFMAQNSGFFIGVCVVLFVIAGLVCASYVTLGYFSMAGRNAPRIIASALAGLSLFGLLVGPLTLIWVALGVAGVILSWLPSSCAHVRARSVVVLANQVAVPAGAPQ